MTDVPEVDKPLLDRVVEAMSELDRQFGMERNATLEELAHVAIIETLKATPDESMAALRSMYEQARDRAMDAENKTMRIKVDLIRLVDSVASLAGEVTKRVLTEEDKT